MSSGHILAQKTSKRARQAARFWHKRFERPCQATRSKYLKKTTKSTTMFLTTTPGHTQRAFFFFFENMLQAGAYHPKRPSLPTMTVTKLCIRGICWRRHFCPKFPRTPSARTQNVISKLTTRGQPWTTSPLCNALVAKVFQQERSLV